MSSSSGSEAATGAKGPALVVAEGSTVVLRKDKAMKLFVAKKGSKGRFGKLFFSLDAIIGQPYGSVYEIKKDGSLKKSDLLTDVMITDVDDMPAGDNRSILDTTESQKLTAEEIERLKEEGVHGEEIIRQLVENSESFQQKTEFSQAKYLKRKQKKYIQLVVVLRPCAQLICELIYDKGPSKSLYLRVDSLAQLLMQANVHSGGRMLVADTCQGLVAGAVLERMAGKGECLHLYVGDAPVATNLDAYNFTPEQRRIHHMWQLDKLEQADAVAAVADEEDPDYVAMLAKKATWDESVQGKWDAVWEQRVTRRAAWFRSRHAAARVLARKNFDGLVVVTKFHPKEVLLELLPLLGYSRSFAVYYPNIEPLVEAYQACRGLGNIIRLELFETWTRPYQVLPMRTHPAMLMNANSGYVLAGIKVAPDHATPFMQAHAKRMKLAD